MIRSPIPRARRLLGAFMLVSLLLASGPPVIHAQDGAPASADSTVEPDRIATPLNPQPGVYYLDYGSSLVNPNTYPVTGAMRVIPWSDLNPADGVYDWTIIDKRITDTKAAGLKLGVMTSTYDGSGSGDIRSTPDFVIKAEGAVIAATTNDTSAAPVYVNYWSRSDQNGSFDYQSSRWTTSGNASVVDGPDSGTNYAAKLGGVNSASGYVVHDANRIPAMPAILDGTKRVYVSAKVYIDTADSGANDHLYMELWDSSNRKLGGTQRDITNLAHTSKTWQTYEFDVSNFGTEKQVKVAFRVTSNSSGVTTFYVDNVTLNVRHLIPRYQSNAYSDPYVRFITAMGERYRSNPDLQYVSFGTGVYGENQPTQDTYDYVVANDGLTQQSWTDYINKVTQAHADAFGTVSGQGPNRSVMVQYAPTYKSAQEREDTTDYAGQRLVGLSANFLSPDFIQSYKNDGTGYYDPMMKYGGQVPLSFESYDMDLCNPVLSYWGWAQALDKHIDYLRADVGLFKNSDGSLTPDAPALAWAKTYVGKTAANTPKAWVIMREHRNPTMMNCRSGGVIYTAKGGAFWPDLGNFEFYLKQNDTITGGKTVAETNDKGVDSRYAKDANGNARPDAGLGNCPSGYYRSDVFGANYPCFSQPYNPDLPLLAGQNPDNYTDYYVPTDWTGEGKEAYTVRRTDQATSNPYMFFQIDKGYIPGSGTYAATITVQYFDIGTDKWSLKYDSTTGEKTAGIITKAGSKALKTATFSVTDGRFGGKLAGGSDFYIDSRNGTTNDEDEWIHMVEIERTTALTAPAAPVATMVVSGADLTLSWPAVTQDTSGKAATVDHYNIWRSGSPYFSPNTSSDVPYADVTGTSFTDVGALSDGGASFYLVTAVNSTSSAVSNRTGQFSFAVMKGQ